MPQINVMKIILEDYGMYDFDNTFYQRDVIDNNHNSYRFANKRDRTNIHVKVNLPDFLEAND